MHDRSQGDWTHALKEWRGPDEYEPLIWRSSRHMVDVRERLAVDTVTLRRGRFWLRWTDGARRGIRAMMETPRSAGRALLAPVYRALSHSANVSFVAGGLAALLVVFVPMVLVASYSVAASLSRETLRGGRGRKLKAN